jgi:hypothetical protein
MIRGNGLTVSVERHKSVGLLSGGPIPGSGLVCANRKTVRGVEMNFGDECSFMDETGGFQNDDSGLVELERSAFLGDISAQIALGEIALDEGHYPGAYAWFRVAAGKGNKRALALFWDCHALIPEHSLYEARDLYQLRLAGCRKAKFCDPENCGERSATDDCAEKSVPAGCLAAHGES